MSTGILRENFEVAPVTNIGELFDALAIGWKEGSHHNRFILASDWGGDFIRVPQSSFTYPFYNKCQNDIPIQTVNYRMSGFIRFETNSLFRGMFEVSRADDGVWIAAGLTAQGYQYAIAGIFDIDLSIRGFRESPFYNPAAREIIKDATLIHGTATMIETTDRVVK